MSDTNIKLRAVSMYKIPVGMWRLEPKCVHEYWDVLPSDVQAGDMKHKHQCEALWNKKGTRQRFELELELNNTGTKKIPMDEHFDMRLRVMCEEPFIVLSIFDLLERELHREDMDLKRGIPNPYKSPYFPPPSH
jgi:hypothetical protein